MRPSHAVALALPLCCCFFLLSACQVAEAPAKPAALGPPGTITFPSASAEDLAIEQRLPTVMGPFRVNVVGFENTLKYWADATDIPVDANWAALEAVGITKTTEITLDLRESVSAQVALRGLLTKAAGSEGKLDWLVRGGVLKVSTVEDISSLKYIVTYNIRDLMAASRAYDKSREKRFTPLLPVIEYRPQPVLPWTWDLPEERAQWIASFTDLLRTMVLPDSWAPTGDADMKESDGLLLVKQTGPGHRALTELLAQIRSAVWSVPPAPPALPRPVLTTGEIAAMAATTQADAADLAAHKLMRLIVPEIRFNAIGFENALNFMGQLQHLNITANWAAMEAVGITKQTEIVCQRQNVTFEDALRALLAKAAGSEGKLDYAIRGGVVDVSTVEDMSWRKYIRVYSIRDLIEAMASHHEREWRAAWGDKLPKKVIVRTTESGSGGNTSGGSGGGASAGSIFGDVAEQDNNLGELPGDDTGRSCGLLKCCVS